MNKEEIIKIIDERLAHHIKQSKYVFDRPIQILDGNDVVLGQTNGTRFGTSPTQEIAFLGSTPRVQWPNIPHPPVNGATYNQTNVEQLRSTVESLMDLLKAFGFLAP
mgnify:CR=1 FL=1